MNFQNVEILEVGRVKMVKMRHHAKFRGDWSNRCAEIWQFFDFQDGGRRHLGFLYFRNSKGWKDQVIKRVKMRLRVKFRGDQSGCC